MKKIEADTLIALIDGLKTPESASQFCDSSILKENGIKILKRTIRSMINNDEDRRDEENV